MSRGRAGSGDGEPGIAMEVLGRVRRHWAALVVVGLLVAVPAVPWVLVADIHGPAAWEPVDTDRPAPAVMAEVTGELREVDHRRVSQVYLLEGDNRTHYATYEVAKDYSNYQYAANLVRYERAVGPPVFGDRFSADVSVASPVQVVQYADDTGVSLGYRATLDPAALPADPVGNYSVRWNGTGGVDWNTTQQVGPNRSLAGLYRPYFSPRGGGWEVVSRNASSVVVGIDDPEAVFSTVPMTAAAVGNGTRVRVVLDADTGRPERIVERRVVTVAADGRAVQRHYVVVTRFSAWQHLDLGEPAWVAEGDLDSLVADLLYY